MPTEPYKKTIVRTIDPKTTRRVPADTPGAKKITEESRNYYAQGVPGFPPRKEVALASDKTAAKLKLAELVRRGEMGEQGIDGAAIDQQRRAIADHVADFEGHLKTKDNTEKQIALTLTRIRAIIGGCKFAVVRDITVDKVQDWLAKQRKKATKDGGLSNQTSNYYLGAFRHFCRWLTKSKPKRLTEDPLDGATGVNADVDRKHMRRELTLDELRKVLECARASTRRFKGTTGEDRYHIYLAAIGTGYRSGELASLTPESFDLEADTPTVQATARKSKNRKRGVRLTMPAEVAAILRPYLATKEPGKPIWPGSWGRGKGAGMLRIDLKSAGIPYVTQGPDGDLFADFHALRHSYISGLARAGVSPKVAQVLARHSDIRLTMQLYSHANLADMHDATSRLAMPLGQQPADLASAIAALPRAAVNALAAEGIVAALLLQALLASK